MKIMNQHQDEFQLLRTTFVFCECGKLSSLISCLTFEPGLPRASRSVRENVNEERLFIAFCSQGKNSILFNILNTHDRPVRPFLRRSSCYAAVAEMGCRLQTTYDYYYSMSRRPKKNTRPPFAQHFHHLSVWTPHVSHVREWTRENEQFDRTASIMISVQIPSSSSFSIQGIPLTIPEAKDK